jgi:predicted deacylase
MLVELRTQHWLYPPSVAAGITGIRNVMQALGMLPGRPVLPETQYEACEEEIVDAPCGGLFVPVKEIGDAVRRNAVLGYLLDLETGRQTAVRSPCTGAVWLVSRVGKSGNYVSDLDAYAERGDMLALIKHVKRLTR